MEGVEKEEKDLGGGGSLEEGRERLPHPRGGAQDRPCGR